MSSARLHQPAHRGHERVLGNRPGEKELNHRPPDGVCLRHEVAEPPEVVGIAPQVREHGNVEIW